MTDAALPADIAVVVIGAGQAGLATSACLSMRGIDHVLIERNVVGHSWKHERWASLRTLTPNWMTRLPGLDRSTVALGRADHDEHEFDSAIDVGRELDEYASAIAAPVVEGCTVRRVTSASRGFTVETDAGTVSCGAVVVASGACVTPAIPPFASAVPEHVAQLTPTEYHSPGETPPGDVLVVGGSASGTQLADELARAGRRVVLATAAHTRMVRRYRGHDVFWWMREMDELDQPADPAASLAPPPSMQLIGTPEHRTLDLNTLQALGVRVAGSMASVTDGVARFADDLATTTADADHAMQQHLRSIDDWIDRSGRSDVDDPEVIAPTRVDHPVTELDLGGVGVVIWATGFRFDFPFLDPAWRTERGAIRHTDGVGDVDGLFVVGMPYNRTRSSNFILGAGPDAAFVVERIARRTAGRGD